LNFLFGISWFRKGYAAATCSATTSISYIYTLNPLQSTTNSTNMPPKSKAPTSPPKSRKRTISLTAEVVGNKRSRRSTRLNKDEMEEEDKLKEEEDEEEDEEEEEEKEVEDEDKREDVGTMDVDVDMDMDKPVKGGRQGKKEKKGGKAAKGRRAEEKRAEEKKYVFILIIFFRKFNRIARLPLEKNGPSPKSKAKKLR
jgi:hypothetical protein